MSKLGKRLRRHADLSTSPLAARDTPTPTAPPPRKRSRAALDGKENDPRAVSKRKSRLQTQTAAQARVDDAGDASASGGDQEREITPTEHPTRLLSPTKTPSKSTHKPKKSSVVKLLPTVSDAPPLPSLASRLHLTPPATPPVVTLSLHARARALLRPGPGEVIGREKERAILTDFLSPFVIGSTDTGKVQPSAAYISGAPGTGKTALVSDILRAVTTDALRGIYVNCTGLKEEGIVWTRILEEAGFGVPRGKTDKSEKKAFQTALKKADIKCIVVLDELDFVLRSPSALASIFEVADSASSALRIIGISNTLTLGASSTKSTEFLTLDMPAYTADDIVRIVQGRLSTLTQDSGSGSSLVIAPTALTFLAKKIATQTGDLRAGLDAVRRTIELAERDANPFAPTAANGIATMKHVLDALRGRDGLAGGQATGSARGLGMQARLVLVSILVARRRAAAGLVLLPTRSVNNLIRTPSKAIPRTPSKTGRAPGSPTKRCRNEPETYEVSALHAAYSAILTSDGAFAPVSRSEFQDLLGVLETCGLVSVTGTAAGTTPCRGTPSRRRNPLTGGEPLVGLAEGVQEEDILRGLGSAGVGGTAGVKEEEAMALWERELKRSKRDVERVNRAADREKEAAMVDGFADACADN